MIALSTACLIFFVAALSSCDASEVFLLKPTSFGFFRKTGGSFSLEEEPDKRSRIYKIEIFSPTKAHYYAQSDGRNYTLISDRCLSVEDSSFQLPDGKKRRTISISFAWSNGNSIRHFLIDIGDDRSDFSSSSGSLSGDHVERGYIISRMNEEKP